MQFSVLVVAPLFRTAGAVCQGRAFGRGMLGPAPSRWPAPSPWPHCLRGSSRISLARRCA